MNLSRAHFFQLDQKNLLLIIKKNSKTKKNIFIEAKTQNKVNLN